MKAIKRTLAVLLTLLMLISAVPLGVMNVGADDDSLNGQYTVLLLDVSMSMEGEPLEKEKEAANAFCETMLNVNDKNQIAIVKFYGSAVTGCKFTNDLIELRSYINSLSIGKSTNINAALTLAEKLLSSVSDESAKKNIVLCSDGIPVTGSTLSKGQYSSEDHKYYKYANKVYSTAAALKKKYNLYTFGFFHSLAGEDYLFGQRLLTDIQNAGYNEVDNINDLEGLFYKLLASMVQSDYSFYISSPDFATGSLKLGETAEYNFSLLDRNNKALDLRKTTISFSSKGKVLEVIDEKFEKDRISVTVQGVSKGLETISLSDSITGTKDSFEIEVYSDMANYAYFKVPVGNYDANFKCADLIVTNYDYALDEDTNEYVVSADVFNTGSGVGTMSSYTCDGELFDYRVIDAFGSGAVTGWKNFIETLVRSTADLFVLVGSIGRPLYENAAYAKETNIEGLRVPKNGYIKVSSDPSECPIVNFLNAMEIILSGIGFGKAFLKSTKGYSDSDLAKRMCDVLWERSQDDFFTFMDRLNEKIGKKVSKKILLKTFLSETKDLWSITESVFPYLQDLIEQTVVNMGLELGKDFVINKAIETLFEKTGAIADLYKGELATAEMMFVSMNGLDLVDKILYELCFARNTGFVGIDYSITSGNKNYKDKIYIEGSGIDETLLRHFLITDVKTKEKVKVDLNIRTNQIYQVHEIALVDYNNKVIDLGSAVKVTMPIPKTFFPVSTKVFRQEKDGAFTELRTEIDLKNRTITFSTDHFSHYILVGNFTIDSYCPWCGGDHSEGFFQKIIAFFHNILAAILGAKY